MRAASEGEFNYHYGKFCGADRPPAYRNSPDKQLEELTKITPIDDIDWACQIHDICYAVRGEAYYKCDELIIEMTRRMDFHTDRGSWAKCKNVARDIYIYFQDFHPSRDESGDLHTPTALKRILSVPLGMILAVPRNMEWGLRRGYPTDEIRCFTRKPFYNKGEIERLLLGNVEIGEGGGE